MKHPGEVAGKSTAVHAKLVSPDDVTIYTWPDCPDYTCEDAVLVFPGPDSLSLQQIKHQHGDSGQFPYSKIVFIDSTWNQCYKICQDERIKCLPKV